MARDIQASGPRGVRSILTGIAGGAFSGLTGVGGGAVMVPLLTGQLKLSQHRAHGTSLAIIMFVAVSGVVGYWQAGNIDWRLVLALVPGAVAGVYAGARAMVRVPALQLRLLFGAFLFIVAFRQLVWHFSAGAPQGGAEGLLIEGVFGFAGGVLAGVLGVGGGAIFVPAIVIFGLAHIGPGEDPQKVAQGVSLVVIIATGAMGTVTNLRQETIDVETVRWVMPAAVAAAFVASLFANRLDVEVLKTIYGITALFLGCQIIYTTTRALRAIEQRV
ncbi:MAG: sulfite exporter TauE/SafE family protein [Chloroflexi bacterium]|nr:sulfite exporter TauE/SafE family protein [Chloroflexota bacterium]